MNVSFTTSAAVDISPCYDLRRAIENGRYDTIATWYWDQPKTIWVPEGQRLDRVLVSLLCFARSIRPERALAEIISAGLRPGNAAELLAFGAAQPDEQRRYPIMALGSTFRDPEGYERYAYLNRDACRRIVGLVLPSAGDLPPECRFLVSDALKS